MGQHTKIEWCDSTLNLQMGCDGCELWNANARHCYAGQLTERYGGRKGWPETFDRPHIFAERLDAALRWPYLAGTERKDKPWLSGLPRVVFPNDMGDTWTESLPLDWLAPFIEKLEAAPWIVMWLTKRPARMRMFFEALGYVPGNFRLGVSITDPGTLRPRMEQMRKLRERFPDAFLWVSAEPMLGPHDYRPFFFEDVAPPFATFEAGLATGLIQHAIFGGESDPGARPCNIEWIRDGVAQCRNAGVSPFVKQLGSRPFYHDAGERDMKLRHANGGNMAEWPEDLRVREFPRAA